MMLGAFGCSFKQAAYFVQRQSPAFAFVNYLLAFEILYRISSGPLVSYQPATKLLNSL